MSGVALAARLLLAGVFFIAAVSKARDRAGIQLTLAQLGMNERLRPAAATALSLLEFGVGVALLVPGSAWVASLVAGGLLILFCAVIAHSMIRGRAVECHCFGQMHSEPLGGRSLVRNGALLGGALVVAVAGGAQLDPVGWFGGLAAVDQVLVALVAALALVVVAQSVIVLQLFARHGAILNRLRDLESSSPQRESEPPGLQPGALAPAFSLPASGGETVSLSRVLARERPALLIFSDPRCGPCNAMLEDVVDWDQRLSHVFSTVLVSRGPQAEVEAKLDDRRLEQVLIDASGDVAARYRAVGTPSAVLVASDGRIASGIAMGPAAIAQLVEELGRGAAPPQLVVEQHTVVPMAGVGGAR